MKIFNQITYPLLVLGLALSSCDTSFEELEKDPNRAVSAPASLVLQGIEYDLYDNTGVPFSSEMRWNQFYAINYNYYGNNEYQWGEMPNHYFTLKNVVRMEQEAKRAGAADVARRNGRPAGVGRKRDFRADGTAASIAIKIIAVCAICVRAGGQFL